MICKWQPTKQNEARYGDPFITKTQDLTTLK